MRASGASKVSDVLEHGEEYKFKTMTKSILEYIDEKRGENKIDKFQREK